MISQAAHADGLFYYYTQDHRVLALEQLYEATKARYSLWDLKKINMQIDGDQLFNQAIQAEREVADVEGPVLKAKSNIQFHERVKKLIASFKDTHFGVQANVNLPMMMNGLKISPAFVGDAEVPVVTAISKKIISFNSATGGEAQYDKISVGDQIIAVDGRPITDKISQLSEYIAGSSPGYISSKAMSSLTIRNFLYGERNFSAWTFRTSQGSEYTVRLPWYAEQTNRADIAVYLRTYGIRNLDGVYYSWDQENMNWSESRELEYQGYSPFAAPNGLINAVEWYADGNLNLRTGYIIKDGKSYGYAQLFSSLLLYELISPFKRQRR